MNTPETAAAFARGLVASLLVFSGAIANPAFGMDESALAALLEEAHADRRTPGLRAAIRFADGRVVRAAVGLADKKAKTPLDDTVGMPGGSTGKIFVAALAMLLVEDGTIALDDPASATRVESFRIRQEEYRITLAAKLNPLVDGRQESTAPETVARSRNLAGNQHDKPGQVLILRT